MARGYRAIVELDGKESCKPQTASFMSGHNKYPLEGRSARMSAKRRVSPIRRADILKERRGYRRDEN